MTTITPCLWFDGTAEEAANFYPSIFPDSRIDRVNRSAADNPSTKAGEVRPSTSPSAGGRSWG